MVDFERRGYQCSGPLDDVFGFCVQERECVKTLRAPPERADQPGKVCSVGQKRPQLQLRNRGRAFRQVWIKVLVFILSLFG